LQRYLRGRARERSPSDDALRALRGAHRSEELDAAYRVYDERRLNEADELGDLESFLAAGGSA
jgi:hypothetical protein